MRTFNNNLTFPLTRTHHQIYKGSHGDDKECVQEGEEVPLGGEDGEEVAAEGEAAEVGDDN